MVQAALIIAAAKEVAAVINKVIKDDDKVTMEKLYEFKEAYEEEKVRPDRDHDDLLKWRTTIKLFTDTVVKEISRPK